MSYNDEKVFKKVSVAVGLKFIHVLYYPLNDYYKFCKKRKSSNITKDYLDFLFEFKHVLQENDYALLREFVEKVSNLRECVSKTKNLICDTCLVYGSRVYDVCVLIINKIIQKVNKI